MLIFLELNRELFDFNASIYSQLILTQMNHLIREMIQARNVEHMTTNLRVSLMHVVNRELLKWPKYIGKARSESEESSFFSVAVTWSYYKMVEFCFLNEITFAPSTRSTSLQRLSSLKVKTDSVLNSVMESAPRLLKVPKQRTGFPYFFK